MKNLLINRTDFTFATTEKRGQAVPYATAGDCFSASKAQCRKGNFKIDLSGTGLRVDESVSWSLLSNTSGISIQDFSNHEGIVISAKCGGWCGHCRPVGSLKLDLITCKVRTSKFSSKSICDVLGIYKMYANIYTFMQPTAFVCHGGFPGSMMQWKSPWQKIWVRFNRSSHQRNHFRSYATFTQNRIQISIITSDDRNAYFCAHAYMFARPCMFYSVPM